MVQLSITTSKFPCFMLSKPLFISTVLLFLCVFVFAQTNHQLSEKNYKVFSVKENKIVSLESIVKDLEKYDILIFGEIHNDSVGHYLEKILLEKIYTTYGNSTALSLEMFERDAQLVLDEYLQGLIREKNFKKEARAWGNYKDYRPMIEFAKEKKLDVVAANVPNRYMSMAGKGQKELMKLSALAKTYIAPLPYDTATGRYYEKMQEFSRESVHTPLDSAQLDSLRKAPLPTNISSFNNSQSCWDATMAYSIYQYHQKFPKNKIFQVNGSFHSDEYGGIVQRLEKYDLKKKTLTISAFPDDKFPDTDFSQYKKNADYIIITDPKVPTTFE